MPEYTRIYNKFEYYEEDCLCENCFYSLGKHGCALDECCCGDIRADAIRNGRLQRERGWFRLDS